MIESRLYLKFPGIEDKEAVMDFKREFLEEFKEPSIPGSGCLARVDTYEEWLEVVNKELSPETCGESRVPATQYLAYKIEDNKLVGIIQIRHELNDFLLQFGGHIGGSIRPTERRKGYSVEQIELAMEKCKELGIDKVLITCKQSNIASSKSIQRSKGVLENEVAMEDGTIMQRFWIDLEK